MVVFEVDELNFTCTPAFLSLMEVFDGGSMRRLQLLAARTSGGAAAASLQLQLFPPQQKVSYGQLSSSAGATHIICGGDMVVICSGGPI